MPKSGVFRQPRQDRFHKITFFSNNDKAQNSQTVKRVQNDCLFTCVERNNDLVEFWIRKTPMKSFHTNQIPSETHEIDLNSEPKTQSTYRNQSQTKGDNFDNRIVEEDLSIRKNPPRTSQLSVRLREMDLKREPRSQQNNQKMMEDLVTILKWRNEMIFKNKYGTTQLASFKINSEVSFKAATFPKISVSTDSSDLVKLVDNYTCTQPEKTCVEQLLTVIPPETTYDYELTNSCRNLLKFLDDVTTFQSGRRHIEHYSLQGLTPTFPTEDSCKFSNSCNTQTPRTRLKRRSKFSTNGSEMYPTFYSFIKKHKPLLRRYRRLEGTTCQKVQKATHLQEKSVARDDSSINVLYRSGTAKSDSSAKSITYESIINKNNMVQDNPHTINVSMTHKATQFNPSGFQDSFETYPVQEPLKQGNLVTCNNSTQTYEHKSLKALYCEEWVSTYLFHIENVNPYITIDYNYSSPSSLVCNL